MGCGCGGKKNTMQILAQQQAQDIVDQIEPAPELNQEQKSAASA